MAHFEVEVKSLLGEKAAADQLRAKMCELDPECACVSQNTQLNHYFTGGDVHKLWEKTQHLFAGPEHDKFERMVEKGADFSVRTRQRDDEILLVVKASMDEGTSENTVTRLEFEEPVSITLEELDKLVIEADYTYQAKWSRAREEFSYKGVNVCLDCNAGYGYLVEFEKITEDESALGEIRSDIDSLMAELGLAELSQDRLARMFDHYNQNWPDYYGTDRTFNIE